MPKTIKKEFIHITQRHSGNGICYEVRYRKNGLNISASSTDLKTAKQKFLEKAKRAISQDNTKKSKILTFKEIGDEWFSIKEESWHPTTTRTYKSYYDRYIIPTIGEYEITKIRTANIFNLMTQVKDKGRAYEDVRSIVNQIFIYANTNEITSHNPVKLIEFKKAEREHGKALSIEEERKLIKELKKEEYKNIRQPIFAMLFFGVRPIEIKSIEIEKDFIKAINAKRKKSKIEYKRIPISIQAKTFINFNKDFKLPCTLDNLNLWLKKILPNHKLYDLRHTFTSRCREHVDAELVARWLGHSPQYLIEKTYNHFSDEHQLSEMNKVNYLNDLFPKLFPKND